MRFGNDVLLEVVDILRTGLAEGRDVSQMLRELDLSVDVGAPAGQTSGTETVDVLVLSDEYLSAKGRR